MIVHSVVLLAVQLTAAPAFAQPLAAAAKPCEQNTTRLVVDLQRSAIKWKGTKFRGLGSHEGTVALRAGEVCLRQSQIVRALFVADMRSIQVTDIPASDPVPRNRLRDHLIGEDFFHVTKYPEAVLFINAVRNENRSLHVVTGTLTMRGITHPVTFYARVWEQTPTRVRANATLELDRHRWGVSYRGSTLRDDLVDDEFTLELSLIAGPPAAVVGDLGPGSRER